MYYNLKINYYYIVLVLHFREIFRSYNDEELIHIIRTNYMNNTKHTNEIGKKTLRKKYVVELVSDVPILSMVKANQHLVWTKDRNEVNNYVLLFNF